MTKDTKSLKAKTLLWFGVLAGPVYVVTSIAQIFTREGFAITRHSWSVLSNGDLGWIHILNFLITGALTILGAIGIQRVLKGANGGTWGPRFLMLYGLFLMLSGIFKADAVDGFPPGTPLGPPTTISPSGILHLVFGMFGFIALITSCIIFYNHFRSMKNRGFALFSLIIGITFFVGFMGLMIGSGIGGVGVAVGIFAFTAAVILSWVWYSLLCWKLIQKTFNNIF